MTPDEKSNSQSSILNSQSADVPKESPRTILFQFVVFPLGIVAIAVGIFFLFGRLASDEQTIPDYLNEVKSGGRRERWQAAYQLSQLINVGEAKKYPNLVDDVGKVYADAKHDDPRIRQYLSMVLGNLGDRRATPMLVDAIEHDEAPETRIYAALALGRLHDAAAVPALVKVFQSDERDVRKAAVYALGEIGDPRAIPALETALNDPIADVRYNVAIALARMNDKRSIGVLREMLDRKALAKVQMRPDQTDAILLAAIPALKRIAPEEAPRLLGPLAQSDPSLQVRSAAKEALGQR